jgi:hypothetical protein
MRGGARSTTVTHVSGVCAEVRQARAGVDAAYTWLSLGHSLGTAMRTTVPVRCEAHGDRATKSALLHAEDAS